MEKQRYLESSLRLAEEMTERIKNDETLIYNAITLSRYDNYTYTHSMNVDILATAVGLELHLTDKDLNHLSQAALLHDIGKVCIAKDIILKKGKLTEEEYTEVKKHAAFGYHILKDEGVPLCVCDAVHAHHENEDGSGYPRGLTGGEIPLYGKVIHVVDVYDALVSKRPYKDAMEPKKAMQILQNEVYTSFDKYIVDILSGYVKEYSVATAYPNFSKPLDNMHMYMYNENK